MFDVFSLIDTPRTMRTMRCDALYTYVMLNVQLMRDDDEGWVGFGGLGT